MDKFVEMVCMDLTRLPEDKVISPMVIDAAIQEAKERLASGEVLGCVDGSEDIAKLQVLSLYRAGPYVYCGARILEEKAPPLSYGLMCGGTVERIREVITKFSFQTVSAVFHPSEPLTK